MLVYYITDRTQFPGSEAERRERLITTAVAAAKAGVDFIQLREKDLTARELEALACDLTRALRNFHQTRLLVNSRVDVAVASGAQGVHLPADDISASEARVIFSKAGVNNAVIGCSCHDMAEIERAESHGADLAVFGPVFGKQAGGKQAGGKQSGGKQSSGKHGGAPEAAGLAGLREICDRPVAGAARMPVLALGGISVENAAACLACGAAGVAGIRLFQANDPGSVVIQLRKSEANTAEYRSERGEVSHPYWPARKHSK